MDQDPNRQPVFGERRGTGAVVWFHGNARLSNQNCLYCGEFLGEGSEIASDKEHLIGRRMVPVGSLSDPASFNLIFRACVTCNQEKAALEDHISAITLLSSAGRAEDARIDDLARRKAANSFDPRHPGKPIAAIRHHHEVTGDLYGATITFGLVSGPQADPRKVEALAFRHIQGLFALVASEDPREPEKTRLLPWNQFGLFGCYPHRDWGHPHLKAIAERAYARPRQAEITSADGYFRGTLRPDVGGGPWYWALEWNASLRLVGWIGDRITRPAIFEDLPELQWMHREPLPGNGIRGIRKQTPLRDDEPDLLFDPTPAMLAAQSKVEVQSPSDRPVRAPES